MIDMHDYNAVARRFWWSSVVVGYAVLVFALYRLLHLDAAVLAGALIGAALAALVGYLPVRIPGTKAGIAGGEIIIFFVLMVYGVPAAILAAVLEAGIASARSSARATSRICSPAFAAINMLACGYAFTSVCGPLASGDGNRGTLVLCAMAFALLYWAVNVVLTYLVIALKNRAPLAPLAWLWSMRLVGIWYVASGAIASLLYLAFERFGLPVVLISLPVIAMFLATTHALAELEVANRHKREFLANMSHELRTPLHCIISGSEILRDGMLGPLTPRQSERAADIHEAGTHLLAMINDILDLSKIEAGRMDLVVTQFDLPAAVGNALVFLRERAARRGIQLMSTVDPALGGVAADERKLKQILVNLVSNAVKFSVDGGVVTVSARRVAGGVEIDVADNGVGIAKADQPALFEAFRQVGSDASRKAEGTGLGLALSRDLAKLHGGTLQLESEVGRGSTFTVFLPQRAAPD